MLKKTIKVFPLATWFLVSSCATSPDPILEQYKQSELLYKQCSNTMRTFSAADTPASVDLSVCWRYVDVAGKLSDHFRSMPSDRIMSRQESEIVYDIADKQFTLYIDLCYAKVRLGQKVGDYQGRSGVEFCDRLVEENRHRKTIEAIRGF